MSAKDICPKCRKPYGKDRQKTRHHVFPQRLQIAHNELVIEICRICHDRLEQLYRERENRVLAAVMEIYWNVCNGFLPRNEWRT